MSSGEGAVVARGLRKDYPLGDVTVQALRGVDLDLPAGKFVVMLGPSGCGKTTLLNLIGGLDIPTAGELSAFGRRLSDLNEARLTSIAGRTWASSSRCSTSSRPSPRWKTCF